MLWPDKPACAGTPVFVSTVSASNPAGAPSISNFLRLQDCTHEQHFQMRAGRNVSVDGGIKPGSRPPEQAQSAVQPAEVAQPVAEAPVEEQVLVQPNVTADPVVEPVVTANPVVQPTITANPVVQPVVNANPTTGVTDHTTVNHAATVTATSNPTTTSTNSYTGGTATLSGTGPQTTLGSVTGSAGDLSATGPVNTVYAERSAICMQQHGLWRLPSHEVPAAHHFACELTSDFCALQELYSDQRQLGWPERHTGRAPLL